MRFFLVREASSFDFGNEKKRWFVSRKAYACGSKVVFG